MILAARNMTKSRRGRLETLFASLLLLLYVVGSVQFENFHDTLHSFEQSLHSFEQEKDPCHRAIYHYSGKEGCDHETHVTAVKNCPLCHVVPVNAQSIAASQTYQPTVVQIDFNQFIFSHHVKEIFTNLPSRAPPVS
jgi:hypothetical protein